MKKLIPAVVVALLVMGAYFASPSRAEPSEAPRAQPAQALEEPQGAPADACDQSVPSNTDNAPFPAQLPNCGIYQGRPCNGSSRPRCQLAPGEPALCLCVNGAYECS